MTDPQRTLAEGKRHVRRVLEQVEGIRWQLIGIALSLREPSAEKDREDVGDEWDEVTELRTVIECVLSDGLSPALEDLRKVLMRGES